MTVPNRREDPPEPAESDGSEGARRGNPASAPSERVLGDIEAASARASTVSHRFGGARYALRRDRAAGGDAADSTADRETPEPPETPDADGN